MWATRSRARHAAKWAAREGSADSPVTVDQNNDMRKIASWAAIATVWTAFAGVYGMNFDYMPELRMSYGYPLALASMVIVDVYLIFRFKRAKWF